MALRRGPGLLPFLVLCCLGAAWLLASRLGYLDRLQARFFPAAKEAVRLSPGDFPAGVTAPMADLASVPLRPTLIGFTARGSAAALLLATGGASTLDNLGPPPGAAQGVLKTGYAMDARAVVFANEDELRMGGWTWRRSRWTGWPRGCPRSGTRRRARCCSWGAAAGRRRWPRWG
jgi:hypothetical protein